MYSVKHKELIHWNIILMRRVQKHLFILDNRLIRHFLLFSNIFYLNLVFKSSNNLMIKISNDLFHRCEIVNNVDLSNRFWCSSKHVWHSLNNLILNMFHLTISLNSFLKFSWIERLFFEIFILSFTLCKVGHELILLSSFDEL